MQKNIFKIIFKKIQKNMKKKNIKKMMKKRVFECVLYIKLVNTVFCRFFSVFHFEKNKVIFLKLETLYLQCNRILIF